MKRYLYTAALCAFTVFTNAPAVFANNAVVEEALRSRPELSTFYQGLQTTGVLNELKEGQPYTIFAPTNEAFNSIAPAQYPCFYSPICREQVAQVLRNHIVPGEKHLNDVSEREGGIMSLFSIDDRHVIVNEYRNRANSYTVDGHKVISENQLLGSVLYRIDGVIATPREMVQFTTPTVVVMPRTANGLPPRVPEGRIVTETVTVPREQ